MCGFTKKERKGLTADFDLILLACLEVKVDSDPYQLPKFREK